MLVKELVAGQIVNLEFIIDDDYVYEIVTRVVGTKDEGVLLEPIEYKNRIIEFSGKKVTSITFNLYADDFDKKRVKWLNVDMAVKSYKGRNYYVVHTKTFNRDSVYSDRRSSNRISVRGLSGQLSFPGQEPFTVELFDLSSAGISFYSDMHDSSSLRGILHFEDTLRGERYSFNLKCQYVRQMRMDSGKEFYGFRIFDVDRKLLSYLFFKPMFEEEGAAGYSAIDKLIADADSKDADHKDTADNPGGVDKPNESEGTDHSSKIIAVDMASFGEGTI